MHTSNKAKRRPHPWRSLEKDFGRIIHLRRNGHSYRSPEMAPHFAIISAAVDESSRRIFAFIKWRVPAHGPDDAAQHWHRYMLERGFDKYVPDRPFYPFGYSTLWHICLYGTPAAWRRQQSLPKGYDAGDDRFNPFRAAIKQETRDQVRDQVESLPDETRQSLIAHLWSGQSPAEIAAEEGRPRSTIDSRLWRARMALRKKIGDLRKFRERFEF